MKKQKRRSSKRISLTIDQYAKHMAESLMLGVAYGLHRAEGRRKNS